jgi:hypothetical protein
MGGLGASIVSTSRGVMTDREAVTRVSAASYRQDLVGGAMSRVGKLPVTIPSGVTVKLENERVWVKGPKGELSMHVLDGTTVTLADGEAKVSPREITATRRSAPCAR